ncbi:MAG: hypothetical protein MI919_09215, partial [Holophagales bacterium]|nr:hypothetical protein [Holophagales bacterium]
RLSRCIGDVFAGMVGWAVLWLGTNAALAAALPGSFREDGSTDSVGILLLILVASVVFSVAAGYLTALVARQKPVAHGLALGIVQLLIGIAVQMQYWQVMPLWYHLIFLTLLLPGNVAGAWLRA